MTDIGIGNLCNSNCVMCTALMPPNAGYKPPSYEEIIQQIDRDTDNSIAITGGEPTARKDLLDILRYTNSKYPDKSITLITNGRMFCYKEYLENFNQIKNLSIITELHSADEKKNDEITQTPGSFKQTFQGIKNLLARGFYVEFRIVISKFNYKEVPEIAQMVLEEFKDVDHVTMFPIDLIGNAYRNKQKCLVRYSELRPFVENALENLKDKIKVRVYHIPFCVLDKKYHDYIERGITVLERRVALAEICGGCKYEDVCPRVWKSYIANVGTDEFRKMKNGID